MHKFCASRDGPRYSAFLRNLPNNTTIFLRMYDYVETAGLRKGIRIQIENCSKIIELKFGEKMPLHS